MREDHVHLCGEHPSLDFTGWMESRRAARVSGARAAVVVLVTALSGCGQCDCEVCPDGGCPPTAPSWDAPTDAPPCAADSNTPLLDRALTDGSLTRPELGISRDDLALAPYAAVLDDAFARPGYRDLQANALTIPCHGAGLSRAFDVGGDHPAANALIAAMSELDVAIPFAPLDPADAPTLSVGLNALLASTSDDPVTADESTLPDGLGAALGPVFAAIATEITAWRALAEAAPIDSHELADAGHGMLPDTGPQIDLSDAALQAFILAPYGPRTLDGPALQVVYAIEAADLGRFAGQGGDGVLLSIPTRRGEIRIAGPGNDAPGDIDPVLFYLDLGGDDVYVHQAGGNANGRPIGVMIDLAGNDTYGYTAVPGSHDGARLPSDADGRYAGDANYGPFSLSHTGRQGSGRFGVGLLFDYNGNDTYTSLRMSQGWGHLGVGVLEDFAGSDTYAAEAGTQGGGSMGIGLLLDHQGADTYDAYADSQGFGYTMGVGALVDSVGDDRYRVDPGDPALGGDPMYYCPQRPGASNASFSQGAGFGRRGDNDGGYLSGGLGLLADGAGNDTYVASVFAQGVGYWQGTGILADRDGNDAYDALYYAQGAGAHYAIGALLDGGGDDRLGQTFPPLYVHAGSGHDFSIGVYVDQAGNDTYAFGGLAAGASNCQGIGIFVDNDGADTYVANSTAAVGLGNRSSECGEGSGSRTQVRDIGLFLDSGGDPDVWTWPDDSRTPADGGSFGFDTEGVPEEHGAAVDGDGATAVSLRW